MHCSRIALAKLIFSNKKGYPVDLQIQGIHFSCTCPNPQHIDKHPSCFGSLDTGDYHCFGCGYGGSLNFNNHAAVVPLNLIKDMISFMETVKQERLMTLVDDDVIYVGGEQRTVSLVESFGEAVLFINETASTVKL